MEKGLRFHHIGIPTEERREGERKAEPEGQAAARGSAGAQGPHSRKQRQQEGTQVGRQVDQVAPARVEAAEPSGVLARRDHERKQLRQEATAVDGVDLEGGDGAPGRQARKRVEQLVDRDVDPPAEQEPGPDERDAARSGIETVLAER